MNSKDEKKHVKKLTSESNDDQKRSCYFTIFNCDDHTCSTGNKQGCNTIIECSTINTGGAENVGICKEDNYGGCVNNLACRPSKNTGRSVNNTLVEDEESINGLIRSVAKSRSEKDKS